MRFLPGSGGSRWIDDFHTPTGLAGAIYGVILLLVIFVMPAGAAGFVRFAAARLSRLLPASSNKAQGGKP